MGEKFDKIKNVKHKAFILNYIESMDGALAYRKVYPKAKVKSSATNSYQLLKNTHIRAAVNELLDELWSSRQAKIGQAFSHLLAMATADIKDVAEWDNEDMTIKESSEVDSRAIQSIIIKRKPIMAGDQVIDTETTKAVKMYDKTKSQDALLKVLGMIDNKLEIIGDIKIIPARRPDHIPKEGDRGDDGNNNVY